MDETSSLNGTTIMKERQFYKKAHKLILQEGKTHQEVYDEFVISSKLGPETVAIMLSRVPTLKKLEQLKGLFSLYLGAAIALAGLRVAVLFMENQLEDITIAGSIFAFLLIAVVPLFVFLGIKLTKPEFLGGAATFTLACLIRSFFSEDYGGDATFYAIIALSVAVMVFTSILPLRMRTGYTQHVIDKEKPDGKIVKRFTYTFDDTKKVSRMEAFKENF